MKRAVRIAAAVCMLAAAVFPAVAAQDRRPSGYVSDFAGVIDAESRARIEAIARELEQKTAAELAVVTVKSLESGSIEDFAVGLFERWGVGKKGKDNGVMLVMAVDDRKVRIEVGYGLEGMLPDGLTGAILDRYVLPEFRRGDYGRGMYLGAAATAATVAKASGAELTGAYLNDGRPAAKKSVARSLLSVVFFFVMLFVGIRHPFLLLLLLGGRGGGSFRGGGFGGGFGGFGGGGSGGGGASRGW